MVQKDGKIQKQYRGVKYAIVQRAGTELTKTVPRAGRYANFANLEEINFEPKLIVGKCIRVRKQT